MTSYYNQTKLNMTKNVFKTIYQIINSYGTLKVILKKFQQKPT